MKSFQNFINLSERTIASAGRVSDPPDPQQQDIEDFKRETSRHRPRPSKGQRQASSYRTPEIGVSWEVSKGWDKKVPSTPEEILQRVELSAEKKKKAQQIRQNVFQKPKRVKKISTGNNPPTPEVVKPLPRLNLDKYRVQTFDPKSFKPVPAKASQITRTTAAAAAPTAMTAKDITKIVKDVAQSERQAKEAAKAASAAKTAKEIGRIGTLGTIAASGFEAKGEYDKARREGASRNRAFGAGAARAIGGLLGGAVGSTVGSIAGLPGAFIGGTAGYTSGANLASAAYKQITGDNRQKLTTQRVLTNIRKAVPQEIRREVPAGARKAFRDLVTQTGRVYGNWRRSQESAK